MTQRNTQYVIVTPVRNEESHLGETIASVCSQTILPAQWVLIDDGSSDRTGAICDEAASKYPWITAIHRADRGFRKQGAGVVEAFYDGYARLASPDWDFIVKLDGDLSFAPDYFERCFQEFESDPKLGIGGGTISNQSNGKIITEWKGDPAFHVRGATKIYRRACWQAIGELIRQPGWDTLDELKANMLGWGTRTFPGIPIIHHRKAGEVDGTWKNWVKNGRANYIVGYHPIFMLFKCIRRTFERPYLIAACGLWVGFVTGYLKRIAQINDKEVIRYLRQQQVRRLLWQDSLWNLR